MAQVAFGAKPTLPKLGDDRKYKTICGTFHQKSNSLSITQKLKAVDALILEERAEGTPRRHNQSPNSRKYSQQYDVRGRHRSVVVDQAHGASKASSIGASANHASLGWKAGPAPASVTPSIHESKRASASMTNWNNSHAAVFQRSSNNFQQPGYTN